MENGEAVPICIVCAVAMMLGVLVVAVVAGPGTALGVGIVCGFIGFIAGSAWHKHSG